MTAAESQTVIQNLNTCFEILTSCFHVGNLHFQKLGLPLNLFLAVDVADRDDRWPRRLLRRGKGRARSITTPQLVFGAPLL